MFLLFFFVSFINCFDFDLPLAWTDESQYIVSVAVTGNHVVWIDAGGAASDVSLRFRPRTFPWAGPRLVAHYDGGTAEFGRMGVIPLLGWLPSEVVAMGACDAGSGGREHLLVATNDGAKVLVEGDEPDATNPFTVTSSIVFESAGTGAAFGEMGVHRLGEALALTVSSVEIGSQARRLDVFEITCVSESPRYALFSASNVPQFEGRWDALAVSADHACFAMATGFRLARFCHDHDFAVDPLPDLPEADGGGKQVTDIAFFGDTLLVAVSDGAVLDLWQIAPSQSPPAWAKVFFRSGLGSCSIEATATHEYDDAVLLVCSAAPGIVVLDVGGGGVFTMRTPALEFGRVNDGSQANLGFSGGWLTDFTGDGRPDLLVSRYTPLSGPAGDFVPFHDGALLFNNVDGPLPIIARTPQFYDGYHRLPLAETSVGSVAQVAVGKVRGNDDLDDVVATTLGGAVLFEQQASGSWVDGSDLTTFVAHPIDHSGVSWQHATLRSFDEVALCRLSGQALAPAAPPDIVLGSNEAALLVKPGTLSATMLLAGTEGTNGVVCADMNSDSLDDLLIGTWRQKQVHVHLAVPNAPMPPLTAETGLVDIRNPQVIRIGDFNNDGSPDIVGGHPFATLRCFAGDGRGDFSLMPLPPVNFPVSGPLFNWQAQDIAIAYVDDDATADLLLTSGDHVLLALGALNASTLIDVSGSLLTDADALCTLDLNGDGRIDLAVTDDAGVHVAVNLGADGRRWDWITLDTNMPSATTVGSLDANNDGFQDIVVGSALMTNPDKLRVYLQRPLGNHRTEVLRRKQELAALRRPTPSPAPATPAAPTTGGGALPQPPTTPPTAGTPTSAAATDDGILAGGAPVIDDSLPFLLVAGGAALLLLLTVLVVGCVAVRRCRSSAPPPTSTELRSGRRRRGSTATTAGGGHSRSIRRGSSASRLRPSPYSSTSAASTATQYHRPHPKAFHEDYMSNPPPPAYLDLDITWVCAQCLNVNSTDAATSCFKCGAVKQTKINPAYI